MCFLLFAEKLKICRKIKKVAKNRKISFFRNFLPWFHQNRRKGWIVNRCLAVEIIRSICSFQRRFSTCKYLQPASARIKLPRWPAFHHCNSSAENNFSKNGGFFERRTIFWIWRVALQFGIQFWNYRGARQRNRRDCNCKILQNYKLSAFGKRTRRSSNASKTA